MRSMAIEASLEALAVRRDTIDDEVGGGVLTAEILEECGRVDQLIKEGPVRHPDTDPLNSADGNDGLIFGLLSDLVHPSHKKYYQAIRAAIGRQHLEAVVDTELPARLLSKEDIPTNSGLRRAEDCVKAANHVPSHLQGSNASRRSIIELIQKLHRWLLGKTVVADSLAQACSVLYHSGRRNLPAMPSGTKAVTLEGDKIAKIGNMSNGQGAFPGDSGDVWDAQNVDSIKAELAQKDEEIARIEEELRELTGTDGASNEAVGDDDDPMDAMLEMARVEMGSLEEIKRVAEEEVNRIEASIEASRGSLAELEMSLIREWKEALDNIEGEVCKVRQQRDTLRGKREALEADLDRVRTTLTSQESNLEELRRALEEIVDEEKAMEAELAATREAGEGAAEELEARVAEAGARREQAATRLHEAGQQSKGIVDRCNELKAAVTKEEHRLQQLRYRHMQL
ncbi:Structural maintenance of chromosomes protein 1B, partial [Perkinsus olseni]